MHLVVYLISTLTLGLLGGVIGRGWARIIAQFRKTSPNRTVGAISAACSIYLLVFLQLFSDGLPMNNRIALCSATAALVFGYFFSRPGNKSSSSDSGSK